MKTRFEKTKHQDYKSKDKIENKLYLIKGLGIKIRNQNIKGQTLNIIKLSIEKKKQTHKITLNPIT